MVAARHRILVAAETLEPMLDEVAQRRPRLGVRDRIVEAVEVPWAVGEAPPDQRQQLPGDCIGWKERGALMWPGPSLAKLSRLS